MSTVHLNICINFQMCKILCANSNMQRSEILSKIQIISIAIICFILCVPFKIVVGVSVIVVGLMSVYCVYQNSIRQYQMIGLFKRCGLHRFTHFTTTQKLSHCKIHNRWHCCIGNNNNCELDQNLLSTMRNNMPVTMMGMYLFDFNSMLT